MLLKKGLQADHRFQAVAAFSESNILFTDSVCSVKESPESGYTKEIENILKNLVGLINSNLFTYFLLGTSSSLGVDRTRASLEEFFAFPVAIDRQIANLTSKIQASYQTLNDDSRILDQTFILDEIATYQRELEYTISEVYGINDQEKALIDYAINVSIPILKREEGKDDRIFSSLNPMFDDDKDYLTGYAQVFVEHFGKRFYTDEKYFVADIYVGSNFVGIYFQVTKKPKEEGRIFITSDSDTINIMKKLGNLGITKLTKNLYTQQDVRGFNGSAFYIIKPNERKCWHKAVAYLDILEFIDAIAKRLSGKYYC